MHSSQDNDKYPKYRAQRGLSMEERGEGTLTKIKAGSLPCWGVGCKLWEQQKHQGQCWVPP